MDALLVSLRQEGVPWQEVAVRLGVSLYAAWSRGQKSGTVGRLPDEVIEQ